MPQKNYPHIFIDTNIYRSLFISEKFAEEIMPILQKLTANGYIILMPQQVIDEINRNRFVKWADGNFSSKKKDCERLDDSLQKNDVQKLTGAKPLSSALKKEILRLDKENLRFINNLTSPDGKSAKLIQELLKIVTIIPDSDEIFFATQKRVIKGNPPFDKGSDDKNADRYIWEAILSYFRSENFKKPKLLFFSKNTSDWCVKLGDQYIFHPFLSGEFKIMLHGTLSWFDDLQHLPEITVEEKKTVISEEVKIAETDKLKIIEQKIAEKLRNSNSWDQTDGIINLCLPYVDRFGTNTITEILKASRDNIDISAGPFNQVIDASLAPKFFARLYKRALEIGASLNEWKQFYIEMDEGQQEKYINLRKSLENKEVKFSMNELKYYLLEDIPF
jgi:hypothetical protein